MGDSVPVVSDAATYGDLFLLFTQHFAPAAGTEQKQLATSPSTIVLELTFYQRANNKDDRQFYDLTLKMLLLFFTLGSNTETSLHSDGTSLIISAASHNYILTLLHVYLIVAF